MILPAHGELVSHQETTPVVTTRTFLLADHHSQELDLVLARATLRHVGDSNLALRVGSDSKHVDSPQ
jgi:hypothetical protein